MSDTIAKSFIKPEQILLLKAALFPSDEALTYWQLWKKARHLDRFTSPDKDLLPNIFDTLDPESQRLMPLVYRNLEKTADPLIPGLRGIYRHTWITNQRLLYKMQQVINSLQSTGIEAMALKGIPLSLLYYKDMGVRLMNDLDVLVPTLQAGQAINTLVKQPLRLKRSEIDYRYRHIIHAIHMWDANKLDIDLHWNLMSQHVYPDADVPFWADRQPLNLGDDLQTYVLSPTHQLFHNMVHGFGWAGRPAIRWITDSYIIYTKADVPIDWDGLLDLAEQYRLVIPIRRSLQLLQAEFRLELPQPVCERISGLAVSPSERALFDLLEANPTNLVSKIVRQIRIPQVAYKLFQSERSGISASRWVFFQVERTAVIIGRWAYETAYNKVKKLGFATSR